MTILEPQTLPNADGALAWIARRSDGELARARELVDAFRANPPSEGLARLQAWNEVSIALSNAASAAGLYSEVHPDAAVRDAADEAVQRIDAYATDLGLDRELFQVLDSTDRAGLDDLAIRFLDKELRDFRRSGVDQDDTTRARLKELAERELSCGQAFSKNIREGVKTLHVAPEDLAGMPQDWLDSHPVSDDGTVIVTTDYPDSVPIGSFCTTRAVRAAMTDARLNVAWPINDDVLRELITVRAERASLLGYANWADFNAETKMIENASAIGEFIDKITAAADDIAHRDKATLLARMQQDVPDATDIDSVDIAYYSELVRKENYDVDAQQVREYFDFAKVRQGLLDVTGRLFGLTWQEVPAQTWHEDVTAYDVVRDGERIGRIYLDLHPREGKYKHAAQFDLVSGVLGHQLPEGTLVCNFSRGLMEHDEVVTLFHEFGHLVHHVLGGGQDWIRFSGVATEWDFVEAPSQMLEEWAWDADVLATFATNAAGEAIPADLVRAMRRADDFGKGSQARTQMFYAALSLAIYTQEPTDLTALVQQLQAKYSVFPYVSDTHFQCGFGHLVGYSSGYYTYMWSLVIAKDMFSAFDIDDLFNADVASRYRDRVLVPGGSRDAADLVADFLGRPYTFDAYADWLAQ